MYRSLLIILCTLVLTQCKFSSTTSETQQNENLLDYIDPQIGVIDVRGSNCVIGPQLPFASINPSPQTKNGSHDGYDPNEKIRGFGQLHASGTGWGKYGQFLISPQIGIAVGEEAHDSEKSNEVATAASYEVRLERYGIDVALAPTHNAAIYSFSYPASDSASLLLDVVHSLTMDIATEVGGYVHSCFADIDPDDPRKLSGGGIYSGGFGQGEYPLYFSAEVSELPQNYGVWLNKDLLQGAHRVDQLRTSDRAGIYLQYNTKEKQTIQLKIAVSFKSTAQASLFLENEISGWDMQSVKENAIAIWNKELNKIRIEGASEEDKVKFYTAMYHSMLMPRDRSADNRFWESEKPFWDDQYAVWDTWRTMYPLMVLLRPDMVSGNINSFLDRFEHNGFSKDAFIAGIDMFAEQGGNNVDNIIADAILKGVVGFDYEEAYALMKHNADNERIGWQGFSIPETELETPYHEQGWIPAGVMSCSYTLEYAYNDFCISEVAKILGKTADQEKYAKRASKWIELWNKDLESDGFIGFICPKAQDGTWINIDAKANWHSWKLYFYEANSWTYSFSLPHAYPEIIDLSGGKEAYAEKLEYALDNELIVTSNEPSFTIVRSFHYADRPDLTSKWVRKIMNEQFDMTGYPGNDDSGAMSSWYIFSALGLFPNAGQDIYFLNSPLFKKATIALANGKEIIIKAPNASSENLYIRSCTLNGKKLDKAEITHASIANGAVLEFDLVSEHVVF